MIAKDLAAAFVISTHVFLMSCAGGQKVGYKGWDKKNPGARSLVEGPAPGVNTPSQGGKDVYPIPPDDPDQRAPEQLLCDEVASFLKNVEPVDYTEQIAIFCGPDGPTEVFRDVFNWAYDGNGTPEVKTLKNVTSENYVNHLTSLYALKAPLDFPVSIFVLNPHDAFTNGIRTQDSFISYKLDSRVTWPRENNAVQTLRQSYNLQLAKNAAVYDPRVTESNIYLLSDTRRDVAIMTERLIDAENSNYWVDQKDLYIIISLDGKSTYIMSGGDYITKNRFDIERQMQAMNETTAENVRMMWDYLNERKTKT